MHKSLKLIHLPTICLALLAVFVAGAHASGQVETKAYDAALLPDLPAMYTEDLGSSFTRTTATREYVSLNGVWQITPTAAPTASKPTDEPTGYVLVPSNWLDTDAFPIQGSDAFKKGAWSGLSKWQGKPLNEYASAWYSRAFRVPAAWSQGKTYLCVDRVTRNATIWLNGKAVGYQDEMDGRQRYDITEYLKTDDANELVLRVNALPQGEVELFLGAEQKSTVKSDTKLRGITGDVQLLHQAATPVAIDDVFIQTSVRDKQLVTQVTMEAVAAQDVSLRLTVRDAQGEVVIDEQQVASVDAGTQQTTMQVAWENPTLWQEQAPYLYTATLRVAQGDKVLDEALPVRFGFREVWIDGRDVLVNGSPVYFRAFHLAPHDAFVSASAANARRLIEFYKSIGFNTIQIGSEGQGRRGHTAQRYADILEIADEMGMYVWLPLLPTYAVTWDNDEGEALWKHYVTSIVKEYRNHPSLVAWSMNFNLLGYPWDMSPQGWADNYQPPDHILDLGRKRRQAGESEAIVKALDDSRVIFHHAGGNYGQMMTSNFYPNWTPLVELENYPSGWAQRGDKPLMAVEFGPAIILDLLRGRLGNYNDVRWSEPLEAEYSAMYLGAEAYEMQSNEYLSIIADNATDEQRAGADRYNINSPYFWGYNMRIHDPVESLKMILGPSILRAWRTYGVTGFVPHMILGELIGQRYEPWHGPAVSYVYEDLTAPGVKPASNHLPLLADGLSELAQAYQKSLLPVVVYVGGNSEAGFNDKSHAYFAGEQIERQIVVLNDQPHGQKFTVQWTLEDADDGTVADQGKVEFNVSAGARGFIPFNLDLPVVSERRQYTINLEVEQPSSDSIGVLGANIEVFPVARANKKVAGRVVAIDPVGKTTEMLRAMGVAVTAFRDAGSLQGADAIVIGQDALSQVTEIPEAVVRATNAGMTMIVFAQRDLSIFGLRTHDRGVRQAFVVDEAHPLVKGFDNTDLSNWRGSAGLREPYPTPNLQTQGRYPTEPWVWGNDNALATTMIEKPHMGPITTLVQCEFDLNYALLMRAQQGKGEVIFNQLLIESRYGKDPVATQVAQRIVGYATEATSSHRQSTVADGVYLTGSDDDAALLKQAGVSEIQTDPSAAAVWVVMGKTDEQVRKQLQAFAADGGSVLFVGSQAVSDLDWVEPKLNIREGYGYRVSLTEHADLLPGIGAADLNFKETLKWMKRVEGDEVVAVTDPAIVAVQPKGRGRFVFLSIDPREWLAKSYTPERMHRNAGKTSRILSSLIDASGGQMRGLMASGATRSSKGIDLAGDWRFQLDPDNKGRREGYTKADFDDSQWRTLRVPGGWENQGILDANERMPDAKRPYDGVAWYRVDVTIPSSFKGKPIELLLGAVDDMDVTYFNGKRIGSTGKETDAWWSAERRYALPEDRIEWDKPNSIVVKVIDERGAGGIMGPECRIRPVVTDHYPYLNAEPLFNPYFFKRW